MFRDWALGLGFRFDGLVFLQPPHKNLDLSSHNMKRWTRKVLKVSTASLLATQANGSRGLVNTDNWYTTPLVIGRDYKP